MMNNLLNTTIKSQAVSGIRWVTFNRVIITILQIVQLAILGRILGPEKFGLIAMVMVVTGFAQGIIEMGLSSAIVQRNDPTKKELSTLYWINIAAGFLIFGIICLLTPLIAHVFNSKEIESLLPVAALVLVISPFGVLFHALFQNDIIMEMIEHLPTRIRTFKFLKQFG
ncbi:oligosaccharide flippase family protein [Thermodesulfobacteriota bacterium]